MKHALHTLTRPAAHHSPATSAEVKKSWHFTTIAPHTSSWPSAHLVKHGNKFNIYLLQTTERLTLRPHNPSVVSTFPSSHTAMPLSTSAPLRHECHAPTHCSLLTPPTRHNQTDAFTPNMVSPAFNVFSPDRRWHGRTGPDVQDSEQPALNTLTVVTVARPTEQQEAVLYR
jgi:hypothetical protein